jgi:hypothetical protein
MANPWKSDQVIAEKIGVNRSTVLTNAPYATPRDPT